MLRRLSLFFIILIALFCLFTFPPRIHAQTSCTKYVSKTGTANGQSAATTISAGISAMAAGDTLCIAPGTYNEQVDIGKSGTASAPLTIRALDPTNMPIIDGNYDLPSGGTFCWNTTVSGCSVPSGEPTCYNANYTGLVKISGQSFITIRDLKIIESRGHFMQVINNAHDITIDHIVGDGARRGSVNIQDGVYNVVVKNSDLRDTGNYYRKTRNPSCLNWPVSFMVVNSAHDIKVLNNHVHEVWGEGISVGRSAHDVLIEGNEVHDNMAVGIYVVRGYNVDVFRNHVYWSNINANLGPNDGIGSMNETKAGQQGHPASHDVHFINNLVAGRSRALYTVTQGTLTDSSYNILYAYNTVVNASNAAITIDDQPQKVRFTNNVILQDPAKGKFAGISNATNVTLDHNLWSAASTSIPAVARGTGDLYVPTFSLVGGTNTTFTTSKNANPANYKFVSNQGTNTGSTVTYTLGTQTKNVTTDYFGSMRPYETSYDIGAYESCGNACGSSTPTNTPTPSLVATATPSRTPTPISLPTSSPTKTPTPTPACSLVGDIDCSGSVNFTDLSLLLSVFGLPSSSSPTALKADIDHNGVVNFTDLSVLLSKI